MPKWGLKITGGAFGVLMQLFGLLTNEWLGGYWPVAIYLIGLVIFLWVFWQYLGHTVDYYNNASARMMPRVLVTGGTGFPLSESRRYRQRLYEFLRVRVKNIGGEYIPHITVKVRLVNSSVNLELMTILDGKLPNGFSLQRGDDKILDLAYREAGTKDNQGMHRDIELNVDTRNVPNYPNILDPRQKTEIEITVIGGDMPEVRKRFKLSVDRNDHLLLKDQYLNEQLIACETSLNPYIPDSRSRSI
ncbi:MAG TPA: hypothetical protein VMM38_00260 [Aridibacter sp.]|nr:hypothetical protein [Aridibacter sp.]